MMTWSRSGTDQSSHELPSTYKGGGKKKKTRLEDFGILKESVKIKKYHFYFCKLILKTPHYESRPPYGELDCQKACGKIRKKQRRFVKN